jgi:hypothetical protein
MIAVELWASVRLESGAAQHPSCVARGEFVSKYNLLPNEVVLVSDDAVVHGKGASGEVILTNLNLVVMNKGIFGNSNGFQLFPVNQIKIYNGQAQAQMSKARNGREVLVVHFGHGDEEFRFVRGGRQTIQTWIAKINEAVTGEPAVETEVASRALPGADRVAGVLKDTLGAFRSKRVATPEAPVSVTTKCISCGAPVNGRRGQAISCPYCDTAQQL